MPLLVHTTSARVHVHIIYTGVNRKVLFIVKHCFFKLQCALLFAKVEVRGVGSKTQ